MIAALAVASCSPARVAATRPKTSAPPAVSSRFSGALEMSPRLFHNAIDEAFWVTHSPEVDRLVADGTRLEVNAKSGEVLAATWDIDLAQRSDGLVGALAVAPHLGGGFIHWSRNQLFRSQTFTGPLEPIHTSGVLGVDAIRGARNGLDSVLVFGETSAAALVGKNDSLSRPPFAGLIDFAALDEKRAIRMDLLGNLASTIDGGKTWREASATLGFSVKTLAVEPDAISVNTWQGRVPWNADGTFGPLEASYIGRRGQSFNTIFRGSRVEDNTASWTWREMAPMRAAILGGVRISETRAVALAPGALGEVDLQTGQLARSMTDWPQPGLSCSTIVGATEPLFVCGWEAYQGYGAYVLRAANGEWPPTIERAFSDDGIFVASDDGALGFVGSCGLTPKYLDPNDTSRMDLASEQRLSTKFCARRGSGEWVEHEIEVGPNDVLQGWAPTREGGAIAIVTRSETSPMPDRVDDPQRVSMQGAVRVVRVPRDLGGFTLVRPSWTPYNMSGRGPAGPIVDRRLQVRDDGSIEAWLSAMSDSDPSGGMHAGAVIDRRGNVTVYPPPARAVMMIATGDQALALLDDGQLAETIDHGRSYRFGGFSPMAASAFSGHCSALGCMIGSIARLGWGTPTTTPLVRSDKLVPAPPTNPTLRIDCSPVGAPEVLEDTALHRGSRTSWPTSYGDAISLVREVENVPDMPAMPPGIPMPAPFNFGPQDATPPPKPAGKPSRAPGQTRTQSLLFRAPFDPHALAKRLDATGSDLESLRRGGIIPLLGKDGEVGLLLISDKNEVLVAGETITTLPLFETRRYISTETNHAGGVLLGPTEPLVFNEIRRRVALEEHGLGTQKAPVFIGQERDSSTRRAIGLARRDDDALALVVWDGSPAGVAAAAEFDRRARSFLTPSPLAPWTTATMADDPRCKNQRGWQLVLPIDPSSWFDVKLLAGLGVRLGTAGSMLVRWSKERLCIEAIDASVLTRASYEWRFDNHLIVRWQATSKQRTGGALLTEGTRRKLDCRLAPNSEAQRP